MKVGGLDGLVYGATVVLSRNCAPPFEVAPKLVRQLDASSPSTACGEHVVEFAQKETRGCDGEVEELCFSSECCKLLRL
jgi:hypothetical protein